MDKWDTLDRVLSMLLDLGALCLQLGEARETILYLRQGMDVARAFGLPHRHVVQQEMCFVYLIGEFSYSIVSSPQDYSKRVTLYSLTDLSVKHHIGFSGKHPATLQLMHEDCSYKHPPLSGDRYSFIKLSECSNVE